MARVLQMPLRNEPRRITYGEFFADILPDNRSRTARWTYIVQRKDAAEILAMGTCGSVHHCVEQAKATMRDLSAAQKKKRRTSTG